MERTKKFLKFFTIASILVWLCMMYMLNDRIRSQTLLEVDPKMTSEGDVVLRDEWMGLYMDSACVGYTNVQLARTLRDRRYVVQTESSLQVNVGGMQRRIETATEATVDDRIEVQGFKFRMFSSLTQFQVTGVVTKDRVHCTLLVGDTQTMKSFDRDDFPVHGGPLCLPETLRFYVLQQQLLPGEEVSVNLLDLATLSLQEATVKRGEKEKIEVLGKDETGTPYYQKFGPLTSTVWLDDDGEIVRETSNMGGLSLVSRRQEKEDLLAVAGKSVGPDILAKSRVPVRASIPDARNVSRLKLNISPVNLDDFPNLGPKVVARDGDSILAENTSEPREESLAPGDTRKYLVSTESMPIENSALHKTLNRLIDESDSDMEKATRIAHWVHNSMSPEPVLSFPNAVEVLSTLKGDCNEHAALFGALSRAAGIPTKLCAGLMLMDEHFYYHAWNEVYIDGKWYTVDTTLAQNEETLPRVDATHLKFVEGELSQQVSLLALIGKLKIDIIAWEDFDKEGV